MSYISSLLNAIKNIFLTSPIIRQLVVILIVFISGISIDILALPPSHYASESNLSSGNWRKISVSNTGMHFISNADLKKWGLNPDKTNVYGYGGRQIKNALNATTYADDLPLLPIVRTQQGIIFYAVNNITWEYDANSSGMIKHSGNQYSDVSYYFLSDRDREQIEINSALNTIGLNISNKAKYNTFTQPLLHEKDLANISNTGYHVLGEDFRTSSSQNFSFQLPGKVNDTIAIYSRFGANITGGAGQLSFKANQKNLPVITSDKISAVSSSDQFIRYSESERTAVIDGDRLDLNIKFSNTGALKTSRLDFIEVFYSRKLALNNDQLVFSKVVAKADTLAIEGCSSTTQIWDVSLPYAPKKVNFNLDNSGNAVFSVINTGSSEKLFEFVAFNPASVKLAVTESTPVGNQNIHGLETPDMVIITLPEYTDAANKVANMHIKNDGMVVHVITTESIYNEFSSGVPDVGGIRKLLKMWRDRGNNEDREFKYCLLMGRPSYDNKNLNGDGNPLRRMPIWQSTVGTSQNTSYSTDDFFGMTDDSDQFNIASAKIRVAVGRWAVKNTAEANTMADKYLEYVNNPNFGTWRNNVLLIADDQDNGIHLDQTERVAKRMKQNAIGAAIEYEKLYLDAFPISYSGTGACYPEAKKRMLQKWNDSMLINYIGHANPKAWTHENLLSWTDINSFSNTNLPFLYAATCEFMRWDDDEVSGAEIMWLYPSSGVIGMVCPSRSVYIAQNGTLSNLVAERMFTLDAQRNQRRIGDIIIDAKNQYPSSDDNKLRYGMLCDPAFRLPVAPSYVYLDSINNVAVESSDKMPPVLNARSKVSIKGFIKDIDGNVINNFSGNIHYSLFDAEKAITTNGNGDNGKEMNFNTFNSRLFKSSAKIENGKWEATLFVPDEIDNNYTHAMLSFYAVSDDGREAHGTNSAFYVYGVDPVNSDFEGPKIENLRLNSTLFTNGGVVNDTPVLFADLSDESGINVSDAGIGHKITLSIDGNIHFDDINEFFSPDASDPTRGSITYPISKLEGGKHTLQLIVWDNLNNSSRATLDFNVGVTMPPEIVALSAEGGAAQTSTVFTISTDRPMSTIDCKVEVFDLSGALVWSYDGSHNTTIDSTVKVPWNLTDKAGHRVPRGIYLYRATLFSKEGSKSSKTKKMAVAAAN